MADAIFLTLSGTSWADDDDISVTPVSKQRAWGIVEDTPILHITDLQKDIISKSKQDPTPLSNKIYVPPSHTVAPNNAWANLGNGSIAIESTINMTDIDSKYEDRNYSRGNDSGYRGNSDNSYGFGGGGSQEPRVKNPIPTSPPWNVYIGNLDYEVTEKMLGDFFAGLDIKKLRIVCDGGLSKGFAYIEFEDREALEMALNKDGDSLHGRSLNVDVASNRNDFHDSSYGGDNDERLSGNWRSNKSSSDFMPGDVSRGAFGSNRNSTSGEFNHGFDKTDNVESSTSSSESVTNWKSNNIAPHSKPNSGSSQSGLNQRTQLHLKPRSKPVKDISVYHSTKSGSNPFGAALMDEEKMNHISETRLKQEKQMDEEMNKLKEKAKFKYGVHSEQRFEKVTDPYSKTEETISWRSKKTPLAAHSRTGRLNVGPRSDHLSRDLLEREHGYGYGRSNKEQAASPSISKWNQKQGNYRHAAVQSTYPN